MTLKRLLINNNYAWRSIFIPMIKSNRNTLNFSKEIRDKIVEEGAAGRKWQLSSR